MKKFFAFLFLVAVASCIDPYTPNLKNYNSLLVVDGLITNENNSYKIKLSRTFNQENNPEMVTDAIVSIIDGNGTETPLKNSGNGYYKTDSTSFTGQVGQKYSLQIHTGDGKDYRSEECTMLPVAGIENVHYEKGEEITGVESQPTTGLKILLNSEDASGMNQYFRWTYEETWKFLLPNPRQYKCLMVLDPETYLFESIPIENICWKDNPSQDIITSTIQTGQTNYINNQLIQFIDPVKSDRLTQQYSILVKQYSISEKEYSFWNNLNEVGQSGGDIFASQPYQVISNIHNVNNAREMVLGYFEVSAVSSKRIFITAHELDPLYLPHYQTDCKEIPKSPDDWPSNPPMSPAVTFYEIYYKYMNKEDYVFIKPEFNWDNTLARLVYAKRACCLCEYAGGGSNKPDFWIDMK